jgi:hypothetical protein
VKNSVTSITFLFSLSIIAASLALPCAAQSGSTAAAIFPESNQAQGWAKSGETRTFPADRLSEYIDGDAEKYIQAGVQRTLTADYKCSAKVDAVVDVFVMKTAEGAAKVFKSQAPTGSQPVKIGDGAGRLYPGSLTFSKGPYFVRIIAFESTPAVQKALVTLGKTIAARLK